MSGSLFAAIVGRDLRLAARRRADALLPIAFFTVAISLFPLGVGPEPQTLREIMTRTERLKGFADDDELLHTLERLQQREAPLVVRIPKAAGQREDRFMHLLCGPVDVDALRASASVAQAAPAGSLAERVAQLEARVEALERLINEKE